LHSIQCKELVEELAKESMADMHVFSTNFLSVSRPLTAVAVIFSNSTLVQDVQLNIQSHCRSEDKKVF